MRAGMALVLLVAASPIAGGQAPTPPAAVVTPAFEVTSVRPNPSRSALPYSMNWFPDGRFRATNMTPRRLINLAYDLRTDDQLMGAPEWIASERFDIQANPAVTLPRAEQRLMLQSLLRDRFGLVMRAQPVDVPIYALVRTQPDAPLPRTVRESTANCTPDRVDAPVINERVARNEPPADSPCGGVRLAAGRLISRAGHLSTLAAMLRSYAGRRVRDRTGLTGRYDFELTWPLDPLAGTDTVFANAGIFTAIQELGLKLEPTMSPEAGYVIERIERPTPN